MNRETFEELYAARSELTVSELHALGLVVMPCDCGEEGCYGWQTVSLGKSGTKSNALPLLNVQLYLL